MPSLRSQLEDAVRYVRVVAFRVREATAAIVMLLLLAGMCAGPAHATGAQTGTSSGETEEVAPAPARVAIEPRAEDEEIRRRLQNVLEATGWFVDPEVRVEDGVVFLSGSAESESLRKWAGDLARNTQDVAAVANRMEVVRRSVWDFGSAIAGVRSLWNEFLHAVPMLLFSALVLAAFAAIAWVVTRYTRNLLRMRLRARLLQGLASRAAGIFVFLAGVYIVLRISGLTQLALTLVGGTGLIGLALGIAFRDITENYLASIFLSIQRPFETGDLVEVEGVLGYVRQLNVRTTVLATLDGNLTQVPNARVYKGTIHNYTTNPNRRQDFVVGIGYDDRIDHAQQVALDVLSEHPAVLKDPEPWILADSLGASTVNLRVYFWLNGREHSWLKVRSSVIRLIKRAFQQHGISMPDEAREVVFPRGVPVRMIDDGAQPQTRTPPQDAPKTQKPDADESVVSTRAEGGLESEAEIVERQVGQSSQLIESENLLRNDEPNNP